MKTLYIECNMGAAGDMLTAALSELIENPDAFIDTMNGVGIPNMHMTRSSKTSCGIAGTHISVVVNGEEEISDDVPQDEYVFHHEHAHEHEHVHHHEHDHEHGHHHEHDHEHGHTYVHYHEHHSHAGLNDIREIVSKLNLPAPVKKDVIGVYELIAEAEAYAHGTQAEMIHFHEVGMADAITDISAVCLLMHMIAPDRVIVSPVCTGFGNVRCMHGILPVPVPAAAYLLRGIPCYSGNIRGELITPTGAALLRYFADEFARMPVMQIEKIGCGMGMKEFEAANCVRVMIGQSQDQHDEIVEISCNLDDMTGEAIGYAQQILMDNGALDVYSVPIQMKKGRPAVMLSCICRPEDVQRMSDLMLEHTTTLGLRMQRMQRTVLERSELTVQTAYGPIRVKVAGIGIHKKRKPEYEDCAVAAKAANIPIAVVVKAALDVAE